MLIVQIEHINAIQGLDAIIRTDGVDGTFIGPYDLSGSMGKPGEWDEPDVKAAIKIYEETAKKYNKLIGFHVVPPDYRLVEDKINHGYNFIAFGFDAMFLGTMVRNQIKMIKK
jgi:2-dehydro-3-deoxyglucarate aldolase